MLKQKQTAVHSLTILRKTYKILLIFINTHKILIIKATKTWRIERRLKKSCMQIINLIGSNVRNIWPQHENYGRSVDLKGSTSITNQKSSDRLEDMRRMNNLVTLFTAMAAFFFGSFLTTMLSNMDKCGTQRSGVTHLPPHPDTFLMIMILSAPQHGSKRQAMRETWLKLAPPLRQPYYPEDVIYVPDYDKRGHLQSESVAQQASHLRTHINWLDELQLNNLDVERNIRLKHFFVVGMAGMHAEQRAALQTEQKLNKDMLLLPRLIDNYANLTEKLLHAMEALTHHYEFSYLLKVDDDSYVKLDSLLNELVSYDRKLLRKVPEYRGQPLPQLYWGYFNGRANIKSRGAWSENNYFLAQHYITYALGGGYLLSRQLCEFVANNSHSLSPYMSEDVSMGTWLAALRQVYRRHDTRFDTAYMPRKCRRQHLVLHKRNEAMMRDLYAGKLCTFETANEGKLRRPAEYYYDWHKTADKCCDNLA